MAVPRTPIKNYLLSTVAFAVLALSAVPAHAQQSCPAGQVGDGHGGCRPVQCYTPGCTEIADDREYIHWSGGVSGGTCPAGAACGTPGCAACPPPLGTDCGAEGQAPNPGATTPGTTADGCCHGLTKCGESCRSCSGGRVCDTAVSLCSCPLGRAWNPRTSVCCPANQVYDLASGRCMSCPAGERVLNGACDCQIGEYRDTSGTCGPCASPRQAINGICDCPGGQTWNAGSSTCSCVAPLYDDGTGTCVTCAPPRSVQPGANPGDPDTCDCPAGEQYSSGPPAACLPECTAPLTRQPDRSCGCTPPHVQVGADCQCPAGQVDDGVGGCREDCDTAVTGKVWDAGLSLCRCPAHLTPWTPPGGVEQCVAPCGPCQDRDPVNGGCVDRCTDCESCAAGVCTGGCNTSGTPPEQCAEDSLLPGTWSCTVLDCSASDLDPDACTACSRCWRADPAPGYCAPPGGRCDICLDPCEEARNGVCTSICTTPGSVCAPDGRTCVACCGVTLDEAGCAQCGGTWAAGEPQRCCGRRSAFAPDAGCSWSEQRACCTATATRPTCRYQSGCESRTARRIYATCEVGYQCTNIAACAPTCGPCEQLQAGVCASTCAAGSGEMCVNGACACPDGTPRAPGQTACCTGGDEWVAARLVCEAPCPAGEVRDPDTGFCGVSPACDPATCQVRCMATSHVTPWAEVDLGTGACPNRFWHCSTSSFCIQGSASFRCAPTPLLPGASPSDKAAWTDSCCAGQCCTGGKVLRETGTRTWECACPDGQVDDGVGGCTAGCPSEQLYWDESGLVAGGVSQITFRAGRPHSDTVCSGLLPVTVAGQSPTVANTVYPASGDTTVVKTGSATRECQADGTWGSVTASSCEALGYAPCECPSGHGLLHEDLSGERVYCTPCFEHDDPLCAGRAGANDCRIGSPPHRVGLTAQLVCGDDLRAMRPVRCSAAETCATPRGRHHCGLRFEESGHYGELSVLGACRTDPTHCPAGRIGVDYREDCMYPVPRTPVGGRVGSPGGGGVESSVYECMPCGIWREIGPGWCAD